MPSLGKARVVLGNAVSHRPGEIQRGLQRIYSVSGIQNNMSQVEIWLLERTLGPYIRIFSVNYRSRRVIFRA